MLFKFFNYDSLSTQIANIFLHGWITSTQLYYLKEILFSNKKLIIKSFNKFVDTFFLESIHCDFCTPSPVKSCISKRLFFATFNLVLVEALTLTIFVRNDLLKSYQNFLLEQRKWASSRVYLFYSNIALLKDFL